tara:strand:- start:321 stop:746 length:426 start_codon:yes stop_codon:yes gene_type:complete
MGIYLKSIQENKIQPRKIAKAGQANPFYSLAADCNKMDRDKNGVPKRETSGLSTLDLAVELQKMAEGAGWRCSYSGAKLNLTPRDFFKISFDRIDNTRGHSIDNLVVTSKLLNYMRGNMPYDEWLRRAMWKTPEMRQMTAA